VDDWDRIPKNGKGTYDDYFQGMDGVMDDSSSQLAISQSIKPGVPLVELSYLRPVFFGRLLSNWIYELSVL